MLKKLKQYFGFAQYGKIDVQYPSNFSPSDNIDLKLNYLIQVDEKEAQRLSQIEGKSAQLISQTGVVFSLIGLFLPMYFDKLAVLTSSFQLLLAITFLFTLSSYLITIFHAARHLNVKKYKYGTRDTATVKKSFKSEDDFKIEELKDLIYCIERNSKLNDIKADHLNYAYRFFKWGNISIGIFSAMVLASIKFVKTEPDKIIIDNPVRIIGLDSITIERVNNQQRLYDLLKAGDSLIITVKSTN